MKKFLSDVLVECNLTVSGSTTLGSASGVTVSASDNSTALATTAFVKAQGYVSTRDYISGVALNGNSLDFTGVGLAFSGSIDLSQILSASDKVVIDVRNESGVTLTKGTPVVITGTQGATDIFLVAPADAADPALMPAIGVLETDLTNNSTGTAITGGALLHFTTDPIDGATPVANQTVYVKPGGGLTLTKPTGGNLIQNIGKVGKVSGGNSGSMLVSSIMRTNDVPNLSQGKIWVGSAANTIESSTVHLDEANGRLGIGTTSPTQALDVDGSIKLSGSIKDSNDEAINFLTNDLTVQGKHINAEFGIWARSYGTVRQMGIDGGAAHMGLYTSGTEKVRIDTAGKVGIGTTSPADELEVYGNGKHTAIRIHEDAGTHEARLHLRRGGSDWELINTNDFTIENEGVERLRIKTGGNVGIGTSVPNQKLTVNGSLGVMTGGVLYANDIAAYTGAMTVGPTGTVELKLRTSSQERMRITYDGNVGIGTATPSYKLHVNGDANVSNLYVGGGTGVTLTNYTSTNTSITSLVNGSTFGALLNSPNSGHTVLQLNNNDNDDSFAVVSNTANGGAVAPDRLVFRAKANGYAFFPAAGARVLIGDASNGGGLRFGNENDLNGIFYASAQFQIRTTQSQGIIFKTTSSGTERMRITSGGNVGIGTASPQAKVQINYEHNHTTGTISVNKSALDLYNPLEANTDEKGSIITFSDNYFDGTNYHKTTRAAIKGGTDQIGNTAAGFLAFYTDSSSANSATERMRIDDSGNVGIGTTTPHRLLDVRNESGVGEQVIAGTTGATLYFRPNTSYSSGGNFGIFTTGLTSGTYESTMTFKGYGSGVNNVMTLKGLGKVGIGTASPTAKLDIGAGTSGADTVVMVGGTGNGNLKVRHIEGKLHNSTADGILHLNYYSAEDISMVASGGNVVIGSGTTGHKLNVNGTLAVTGEVHLSERLNTGHDINFTNDGRGIDFYGANFLKKVAGRGMVMRVDAARDVNDFLAFQHGANGAYTYVWHSGNLSTTSISNWNDAYSWGDHAGLYAAASHNHSAADITSGTLDGARLPWSSGNDGFTGTYGIVWRAGDNPWTASWLTVNGATDTLNTRNISATGDITLTGAINLANGVVLDHGAEDGDPAGTIIETFSSNTYIGAFLDFTIYNDDKSNMRSGTLQLVFNQGEVMFNEVNTMDIGDTSPCTLTATNNAGNVEVRFTTPDPTFHIKYHVRTL